MREAAEYLVGVRNYIRNHPHARGILPTCQCSTPARTGSCYPWIPSSTIGEIVMEELKTLDEVAYVRFASVYREFKDVNTFMDELKKILE